MNRWSLCSFGWCCALLIFGCRHDARATLSRDAAVGGSTSAVGGSGVVVVAAVGGSPGAARVAGAAGVQSAAGAAAAAMSGRPSAAGRPSASDDVDAGSAAKSGNADAGSASAGPATRDNPRPCDLYASGNTPCVAAHSTVRALFSAYKGNLYRVQRADDTTKDIPVRSAGGMADAALQDSFCAGSQCVITTVYDQSGHGNHLEYQGPGSTVGGRDKAAPAGSESLSLDGQKVYSLYINPGNSYWRDGHATGIPTGAAPEGMYMVTSGTHVNGGCCFDYGNSETTRSADGAGAMDAIYFGTSCWFGSCSGTGPWVQADLEYGLFPGGSKNWNAKQVAFKDKYVTAILKNNGTSRFAIKGGNAQSGALVTLWEGALPSGYSPMKKQGAIVLGSGGDCCARNTNQSLGTFYEGAMVSGYPSDETESALQANIVAAGYGR